jgi:hypothetical protein
VAGVIPEKIRITLVQGQEAGVSVKEVDESEESPEVEPTKKFFVNFVHGEGPLGYSISPVDTKSKEGKKEKGSIHELGREDPLRKTATLGGRPTTPMQFSIRIPKPVCETRPHTRQENGRYGLNHSVTQYDTDHSKTPL